MKKMILLVAVLLGSVLGNRTYSQSFTMLTDTIYISAAPGFASYFDSIVTGTAPVTYTWKVIDCNFPGDWRTATASGFCDNDLCLFMPSLWPTGAVETSAPYLASDTGVLDLTLDLTSTSTPGCYYVTVMLHNVLIPTDSAKETFIICYSTLAAPAAINNANISLYPNPANSELNLSYAPNAGITSLKVFDVMGTEEASQATGNSTSLVDIHTLSKGVHFIRLINQSGEVVAIRKFVKD